ncbi:MAG: MATE family efflux transporter [Pseudomonadota bacterium]
MADTTAPPLSHRRILQIAVPVILANITVPLIGLVDTGVVGRMGDPVPIAAVGIGAVILTGVYWIFGFLRMGTTGFAAQAIGAGDGAETSAILLRGLLIAGAGGLALVALQAPIFALGFEVSPASDAVEALARDYMAIRIWSAPALIATYALTGWLIAAERTRAVLALQLVMNGVNVALDLVFVPGFGWGVQGVAAATLIAEVTGCAMGLWLCRDGLRDPAGRAVSRLLDAAKLRRFASVNSDILIRSLLLQAIFMSFLFFGARYGDVRLAANHILLQFLTFTAFAMDGFAFAVEALVGRAKGAGDRAGFRRAALLTSFWGGGAGFALALAFALAGGPIIDLLTTAPDVRSAARDYLIYMALTPLVSFVPFMLDGIFIGATRTRDMRNMMALSAAIYFAAALALMPLLGNDGLWIAVILSFVARGATLGWRYPALERSIAQ